MKKFAMTFLVVTMVASLFSGCAKKEPVSTSAPTQTQAQEGETKKDPSELKAVLLINGTLGDKSFYDLSSDGMTMIADKYGIQTKVIEMSYDETKWEPILQDVVEEDWDYIVCGTWQMTDYVAAVAGDHPEKKFIVFDTSMDYSGGQNQNVYSIEYKQNQGSFLAGVVAANLTKTNKIGFIGGMDTPVINDFLAGYMQGGLYVNPDIKVASSYIGNYDDAAKGKELAFAQYGQDVDVIFSCASIAGNGALEAAVEKNKLAIGVDADQAMLFEKTNPDMAKLIATSVLKRVDISIVRAIDLDLQGKLPFGQVEQLGIEEECIGIATNPYYEALVPEEVRKQVLDLEAKIQDGTIVVDTAIGVSTEDFSAKRNAVKP